MPDFPSVDDPSEFHHAYIAFTHGEQLFDNKQFEEAIPYLQQAVALRPDHPDYLCLLANTLADNGQSEAALVIYDQWIELFPADLVAYRNRAITLWELGQGEAALADLERALGIEPEDEIALINQAVMGIAMGKEETMITDILKAISMYPTEPRLLLALKGFEEKMIHKTPANPEDQLGLSWIWFLKGNLLKALQLVNHVIDHAPDMAIAWHHRGWYKQQQSMWIEALKDLEKAVELDPRVPDHWDTLGVVRDELGLKSEAIEAYQKAIEADPQFWRSWYNLGVLHGNAKRLTDALVCYERAHMIFAEDVNTCINAAVTAQQTGDLVKAASYFQKAFVLGDDESYDHWIQLVEEIYPDDCAGFEVMRLPFFPKKSRKEGGT